MLELRHINKTFNPGTVNEICFFEDFSLTVETGQFVSVIGSNGSGKTSMLNIICGSIDIDSGQVIIDGEDISKMKNFMRHRRIGRVYQNPALGTCPEMTIMENSRTRWMSRWERSPAGSGRHSPSSCPP